MDLLEAVYGRRAVRSYTTDPIDEFTIRRLLHAAVQAPCAMNAQTWGFAVVQERNTLQRYSDLAKTRLLANRERDSKASYHDPRLRDPRYNIFHGAGTLIVICGTRDDPWAAADCWLAAENLMLVAGSHGLGSCCIGLALPLLSDWQIRKELRIPEAMVAIAPVVVGKPDALPRTTERKPPRILSWLGPDAC